MKSVEFGDFRPSYAYVGSMPLTNGIRRGLQSGDLDTARHNAGFLTVTVRCSLCRRVDTLTRRCSVIEKTSTLVELVRFLNGLGWFVSAVTRQVFCPDHLPAEARRES